MVKIFATTLPFITKYWGDIRSSVPPCPKVRGKCPRPPQTQSLLLLLILVSFKQIMGYAMYATYRVMHANFTFTQILQVSWATTSVTGAAHNLCLGPEMLDPTLSIRLNGMANHSHLFQNWRVTPKFLFCFISFFSLVLLTNCDWQILWVKFRNRNWFFIFFWLMSYL